MANNINRFVVIGNLTADAVIEYTPSGQPVAKFSIAVNRTTKRGDQWAEETSYFDVQMFGKTAESLRSYLPKGKTVGIDGWLKQDRWQDKQTGGWRSKVVINANDIQLLGGKTSQSNPQNDFEY